MEVTLSYNPFDKKFRIYKGQTLITETTNDEIAYDTYMAYKNRADKVFKELEEKYKELWDLELEIAEG